MYTLTVEDWVRRNLDDTNTLDYFPGSGELEAFCWQYVIYRYATTTLVLYPIEQRLTPVTTPGSSHFWAYPYSQFVPSLWNYLFRWRMLDSINNKNHKYGFYQAGVRKGYYLDNREDGIIMSTESIHLESFQANLEALRKQLAKKWLETTVT